MARTYTTKSILPGGQVKDDDFNSEVQSSLQEFNGSLDQHQLPLHSISHTNLAQPTKSTTYLSQNGTYSCYMTTQSYHETQFTPNQTAVEMIWDDTLYSGYSWIKLQDLEIEKLVSPASTGGAELIFNSLEGMIAGCAVIDFTWFAGGLHKQVFDPAAESWSQYGLNSTIEWGVFVDDVLVSKSGAIWPRRMTLNLPFNSPVSSKPLKVDIRFRIQFIDPFALQGEYDPTKVQIDVELYQKLTYNGGCLWSRNQYR
jgi:hypothetical protein